MKQMSMCFVVFLCVPFLSAQKSVPSRLLSKAVTNERFKFVAIPCSLHLPCPAQGVGNYYFADGVWKGTDRAHDLIDPEQVSIQCDLSAKECAVDTITFELNSFDVTVEGPSETDYTITSRDKEGLLATFGPTTTERCHRSVISMDFGSGAVYLSDFPTRAKGCEIFSRANSYRLAPGNYYIDTTVHNDSPEGK